MSTLPKGLRNYYFQTKKSSFILNSRFKTRIKRVKSVNILREQQWDNRFIYDKIPNYDSFSDKNVLLNLKKKCHSSRKKFGKIKKTIPLNFIDDSLFLYRPLSNKTAVLHPLINSKNINKTFSAKTRDITNISNRSININSKKPIFYKFYENYKKDENIKLDKTNISQNNFNNINLINLKNVIKLWDELYVNKNYKKLFCVIYKELDDEDKEELYQKETNELLSIKNYINNLKNNIELRQNSIKEIYELNKKLNTEVINKDNQLNENIISEISDKINLLREHTIQVCKSMKKLKYELNGIKCLDKYDINLIAEKYKFDKNYLIKMKGELNFLKGGFAKYYFNIKNDHSPFLIKASEKSKIENDKEPFIHLVPIDKELKNDIMECNYYIYQELIAYQNEKINQKLLRCISPIKRIILKCKDEDEKTINGKEEKEKEKKRENFINDNSINQINNPNNSFKNELNLKQFSSLKNEDYNIKDKEEKNKIKNNDINNCKENNDKINDNNIQRKFNENSNINQNEKTLKTGIDGSKNKRKNDYKNIFMNYKINERSINKKTPDINGKKNNTLQINKLIIKNNKKSKLVEDKKNNEDDIKEDDKYIDKFLLEKGVNKNNIKEKK